MTFGIESSNIVGYTTKEAPQGIFKIYSAPFEGVVGNNDINTLIASGIPGVDFDEDAFKTAAQVQIPNALGSYDTYYYFNDGWYDNGTEDGALKPGWCDSDGYIVERELVPGVAYWIKSIPASATPTIAGAVPAEDSAEVDCPIGFALRANAYPLAIDINGGDMISENIVGVDFDENAFKVAPQIQIPNTLGSYDTYYYFNDGWYDNGTEDGALKPGWCDSDGYIVEATIPVMQGFWTKGVTAAFTLKFTK